MNENSIKLRTIYKEFTFDHRYGDNHFFFVWKNDGLDPEQRSQIPNHINCIIQKLHHPASTTKTLLNITKS